MQLTFDPANHEECATVALILDALHPTETLRVPAPVAAAVQANPAGAVQALQQAAIDLNAPYLTIGADAPDTRDPAAAFGAAGAAPLAPLPGAQQVAAALQSFSAPGAPLAGAPAMSNAAQPNVATGPAPGVVPSGVAPVTNPVGGVELDTTGLPWDVRIHASTKSKTKAGQWVKLRGLNDEAKYNAIVAELRATMALPSPQAQPAATGAPLAGPATLPGMNGPASSVVPVQQAATLPQGSPLPATGAAPTMQAAPSDAPANFDELMPRITAVIGKTIPEGALEWAIGQHGLQGTVALIQRPDFVPAVWATLKTQYPALQ